MKTTTNGRELSFDGGRDKAMLISTNVGFHLSHSMHPSYNINPYYIFLRDANLHVVEGILHPRDSIPDPRDGIPVSRDNILVSYACIPVSYTAIPVARDGILHQRDVIPVARDSIPEARDGILCQLIGISGKRTIAHELV